jgi:hypothetical protein
MDLAQPHDAADAIISSIKGIKGSISPAATENTNPAKAAEIIGLRCAGESLRSIEATTGVGLTAIQAIIRRHPEVIAELQQSTSSMAVTNAHLTFEVYAKKMRTLRDNEDALDKVNPKDIAIAGGIMVEKAQLLQGKATSINETRHEPSMKEVQEGLRQLKQGTVIDIPQVLEDEEGQ